MIVSPGIAVCLSDLAQLVHDDLPEHALVGENVLELGDVLDDLGVFVEDLLALEGRQPAKLQIEDRLCLDVGELEAARSTFCSSLRNCSSRLAAGDATPFLDLAERREIAPSASVFASSTERELRISGMM